ncbi:MAG: rhomboid family intramembrane serine protease [Chloroflexi bacterium]|nr:rhomboid family intramembrane serine protease [Chloroflexota bacterium]MDL1942220.1 rhomboid family intramembrane serine protease [Chloroflexi bacterium CFX2]
MLPLYDTARPRRFPLVNWILVLLNGLVFYYEITLGDQELYRFIRDWGLVPAKLTTDYAGSWVTIVTSMFLHGGWVHILANMWTLIVFGDNIEDRMGHAGYLVFYLFSGSAAALLQTYLSPASQVPMVGASGAIAGVLGAYLILFPHARVASLVPIFFIFTLVEIPAAIFLGFWFVSQLFSGWLALQGADLGGIAWWAHIGGFVFGMFSVRFFARRRY